MLFRGEVDRDEAQAGLEAAGYTWLELLDNGVFHRSFPGLDVAHVHAYHLGSKGVGKATGVRRHLAMVGTPLQEAAAIGDSPSDLDIAAEVGAMFVTANGKDAIGESLPANARFTEATHGDGFAEAVAELLG
jgi:hydroxymethylpyrimidine pyrophosphatase-like HAD family hydrolase